MSVFWYRNLYKKFSRGSNGETPFRSMLWNFVCVYINSCVDAPVSDEFHFKYPAQISRIWRFWVTMKSLILFKSSIHKWHAPCQVIPWLMSVLLWKPQCLTHTSDCLWWCIEASYPPFALWHGCSPVGGTGTCSSWSWDTQGCRLWRFRGFDASRLNSRWI